MSGHSIRALKDVSCITDLKLHASAPSGRLALLRPVPLAQDGDSDGDNSTRAPSPSMGAVSACTSPTQAPSVAFSHSPLPSPAAVQDGMYDDLCVRPPPGLPLPSSIPSHGSALHHLGMCRPCGWFHKPQGCQNGQDCGHCHLCPEGAIAARRRAKRHMNRGNGVMPMMLKCCMGEQFQEWSAGDDMVQEDAHLPNSTSDLLAIPEPHVLAEAVLAVPCTPPPGLAPPAIPLFGLSSIELGPLGLAAVPPCDAQVLPASEKEEVLSSVGSSLHGSGACKPCAFFHRSEGCQNGKDCTFCHTCPASEVKARRKARRGIVRSADSCRVAVGDTHQKTPLILERCLLSDDCPIAKTDSEHVKSLGVCALPPMPRGPVIVQLSSLVV